MKIIGVYGSESSNAEFKLKGGASTNSLLPYYISSTYLIDLTTNSGRITLTKINFRKLYLCVLI